MPQYTDQTGRSISLSQAPERIVSTVPSQTELLADLGLGEKVVGITGYCVHPEEWRQQKAVIGGTKDLQIDKIRELKPDLIIGNKEENVREQIEELAEDIPVWLSDVRDVDSALDMISAVGALCGKSERAAELLKTIRSSRAALPEGPSLSTAYFIWKDPWMLAGHDSFISAMMQECGLQNAAPRGEERYPSLKEAQLPELPCDLYLLSSEPYAFNTQDAHSLGTHGKWVKIIDGELFSWYGSRMALAFRYFQHLRRELDMLEKSRAPKS